MRIAIFALVSLFLVSCQTVPIEHPTVVIPGAAADLSQSQIEDIVATAGAHRTWQGHVVEPGLVELVLNRRTHTVVVHATINDNRINLDLQRSVNMKQANGRIHNKYSQWVNNLSQDIRGALLRSGN